MPSLQNTLLVSTSILSTLVSAVPLQSQNHHGIRVNLVPTKHTRARNGPAAYAKALKKFGGHEDLLNNLLKASKAAGGAEASSVNVTSIEQDLLYLAPVKIGDQTFQLDFDTGSSDLWVLDSSLSSKGTGSANHTFYKPSSSASVSSGSTWSISYGDGSSASGKVYTDTVTVGNTTVTSQAVEAATTASPEFLQEQGDGLMGLAFSKLNTIKPKPATTFFDTAVAQGLPQSLFTALLKKGTGGSYTFGKINEADYTGEITYTDVDSSQGFWMFSPDSYSVGSSPGNSSNTTTPANYGSLHSRHHSHARPSPSSGSSPSSGTPSGSSPGSSSSSSAASLAGIADTGTTLMLIDDAVVTDYYSNVPSAKNDNQVGGYTFDCSEDLPDFTLQIGSYAAVVPGSFINYAPLGDGSNSCYGGIQSSAGIGFGIYGDIFLKSQFVIFDATQETPRLGFAAQA